MAWVYWTGCVLLIICKTTRAIYCFKSKIVSLKHKSGLFPHARNNKTFNQINQNQRLAHSVRHLHNVRGNLSVKGQLVGFNTCSYDVILIITLMWKNTFITHTCPSAGVFTAGLWLQTARPFLHSSLQRMDDSGEELQVYQLSVLFDLSKQSREQPGPCGPPHATFSLLQLTSAHRRRRWRRRRVAPAAETLSAEPG